MKEWFYTLIFIGFLGIAVRLLLPAGEKSKLYPPLRFLLSLLLMLTILSPIFRITKQNDFSFTSYFEDLASPDADKIEHLLLERSAKEMSRDILAEFPEASFTLYIYTDKNSVPTEISVSCQNFDACRIADYLETKYGIPSKEYIQGDNKNGIDFKNE